MNYLRYKDDGSLFTNLIEYKGLYLINAIIAYHLLLLPILYLLDSLHY